MFQVEEHSTLYSSTSRYLVVGSHKEGRFGKVVKCFDLDAAKMVAIKCQKKKEGGSFRQEVAMLEAVGALDRDKKNIVRFIEHFRFQGLPYLVFEMLDRSLLDLMLQRELLPLSLSEIRLVTHQLLVSLEALQSIGVMHTDIKLDNVMLVDHQDQPFKIKLIDFGLALPVSQVTVGKYMQNLRYRAPEVTLGLPLSEAVDMWGVGCVMTELYFGVSLFPHDCSYNWMRTLVQLVGQPEDRLLAAGKYSHKFFVLDQRAGWRLRTPQEYAEATGARPVVSDKCCRDLENAVKNFPDKEDEVGHKDKMAFLDLMKRLYLDAERRIRPSEALRHPFLTMVHMADELESSPYADAALELMTVSPLDNLDESFVCAAPNDDGESDWERCRPSSSNSHTPFCRDGSPGPSPDRSGHRTLFQSIRRFFRRVTS